MKILKNILAFLLLYPLACCNSNNKPFQQQLIRKEKDTLKAMHEKTISIDSVGNLKFNKNSPIQILSASKQLDTTLSYYRMDTAKCKNWELSKNDILHIFKFSKQISGTEWDLNYEVLPCSYKGEFIIGSKKGRYEVNAASFVILIFKDTTIYLGCNLEYKHFLSHPQ